MMKFKYKCNSTYVLFVTNGIEFRSYRYDEKENSYIELKIPPTYAEMISGALGESKTYDVFERPDLNKAKDPNVQKMYTDDMIIGIATKPSLAAHIINLFECLIDTTTSLSSEMVRRLIWKKQYVDGMKI